MASSVLPQPALPHTNVGRPRGNPPSVISSRPVIPVGVLGKQDAGCGADGLPAVAGADRIAASFGMWIRDVFVVARRGKTILIPAMGIVHGRHPVASGHRYCMGVRSVGLPDVREHSLERPR
jgi:hypothetical protein